MRLTQEQEHLKLHCKRFKNARSDLHNKLKNTEVMLEKKHCIFNRVKLNIKEENLPLFFLNYYCINLIVVLGIISSYLNS